MCYAFKVIARCLLIISNTIFLACGVALLFFGLIGITSKHSMTLTLKSSNPDYEFVSDVTNVPDLLMSSSVFMIIVGLFVMIVALIGFIGAAMLLKILLLVYVCLVGAILIAQIALFTFVVLIPAQYQEKGQKLLYKSLEKQYNGSVGANQIIDPVSGSISIKNGHKVSWLMLEIKFSCCGAYNYNDYKTIDWNRTISLEDKTLPAVVPFSCCRNPKGVNLTKCLEGDLEEINTEGCYKAVTKLVSDFCTLAMIFAIISIAVQILLLWASLTLFCSL